MPSLVEIGPVVLEKMKMWRVYRRRAWALISITVNKFQFIQGCPLNRTWHFLEKQKWIQITYGCFVPSLVEIAPKCFWRRWKLDKVTVRQVIKQTDSRWSEKKLACTFSSGDLTCKTEHSFHILAIIKDNLKIKNIYVQYIINTDLFVLIIVTMLPLNII